MRVPFCLSFLFFLFTFYAPRICATFRVTFQMMLICPDRGAGSHARKMAVFTTAKEIPAKSFGKKTESSEIALDGLNLDLALQYPCFHHIIHLRSW